MITGTIAITIFVLALFVGVEVIGKVPTQLHTPLMSGSNAISGITIIGAILAAGASGWVAGFFGMIAVAAAMVNVVGGYMVTDRMLGMFSRKKKGADNDK
ncbi:MAG: NAD(P) transhydrogenase subunit alpha [Phycisphaerae bacterium]|jgi:NAD(P) transhydrogenase subunit alpha|nr:NAD(P) transhydrogenase subunit alpha [Phycisphaerae bacterium]MDP7289495.1 NAD(P) transhydrogenase subunit alpha [Phycisphaerae bacterium]